MGALQIDVAPAVLVWARESIGLSRDEAARRLSIAPLDLRFLEEGVGDISLPRLRRMAEVYDRPLLAFFLPEPPTPSDALPDFRLVPGNREKPWSPELHRAYRRVQGQREIALELAELDEEPPTPIGLTLGLDEDPERAADRVRAWLGMSDRRPSGNERDVFNGWVRAVEARAVFVTQVGGIALDEMRGFSIAEHPFPVVAINGKDAPRAKTFTLMHEVVHVLLRSGALCDLADEGANPNAVRTEGFCNRVAAAVLIPREALVDDPIVADASASSRWSDADLGVLADRFGVSMQAMLLRLVEVGKASREFYRERHPIFLSRFRKHARDRDEESSGGPSYYRMKVRNLGRRFVSTVLRAYEDGEITAVDAGRYLDVKIDYLPKLAETLGGAVGTGR